jgi:hypothetical protein
MVDAKLNVSLQRANELLKELEAEYAGCLATRKVSDRAEQLTHEVLERLRSVLDRTSRKYWDLHISATITQDDRERAHVYFPITNNLHDFDSVLGRWRWKSVRDQNEKIYQWLLAKQPFQSADNKWLAVLNDLATHGKHISLVAQKTIEDKRITVSSQGGGRVSYGPGVRFGSGVRLAGALVNPVTQRVIPTPGVTEKVEVWVSFVIESHKINAFGFCAEAVRKTEQLLAEMSEEFGI